jgi:DNA-binding response OmpR family regulator
MGLLEHVMAGKKILIVDYDEKNLQHWENLFTAQKLQVIKASDGLEAYEVFKRERPDAIVLEAMLPKLHGFDLTQKISSETKGRVPVVIVTGLYKGPQYKNEAIRSFGASGYFEKPYDKNKLVNTVLSLLQDEIELPDELPDPESVLNLVSQLGVQPASKSAKKASS